MGTNSRARRAAKQRKQQHQAHGRPLPTAGLPGDTDSTAFPPTREVIEKTLGSAAYALQVGDEPAADAHVSDLAAVDHAYPALIDQVAVPWLERLLTLIWQCGWQPADLVEAGSRKLDESARRVLPDVIASEHRRYSTATTDPRWRDQLTALEAEPWWDARTPQFAQWAASWQAPRVEAMRMLVSVAAFLMSLPRLPRLMPIPGEAAARSTSVKHPGGVDDKTLSRIRGLLAKAESTDFPEEAEALSSKAQEMMTKHSLNIALLDADDTDLSDGPAARRVWVEAPYASAKIHLVHAVAVANGCRTVSYDKLGFITVLGEEVDLQLVELLSTSLLVQASRAMLRTKSQVDRFGQSRTRSYRQSFLLSYASRIGERLREACEASQANIDDADRDRLLPVLARREERVAALFTELFPDVRTRRTTISNHAGWAAGRAAADQASLNARRQVRRDE